MNVEIKKSNEKESLFSLKKEKEKKNKQRPMTSRQYYIRPISAFRKSSIAEDLSMDSNEIETKFNDFWTNGNLKNFILYRY